MDCKTAQLDRVFNKLEVAETSSIHHRRGFIIDESGKKLFPPIYFSKGRKDIGPEIANQIRKALFLNQQEFQTLVKCHMSRAEYLEIRRTR